MYGLDICVLVNTTADVLAGELDPLSNGLGEFPDGLGEFPDGLGEFPDGFDVFSAVRYELSCSSSAPIIKLHKNYKVNNMHQR